MNATTTKKIGRYEIHVTQEGLWKVVNPETTRVLYECEDRDDAVEQAETLDSYCYLYDSDTNDYVSAEDLGITHEDYDDACAESADCGQAEGHIVVNGRRVYASE